MGQLVLDESLADKMGSLARSADMERRRTLVRSTLAAVPGERLLDVGCGPGFYVSELLDVVGADGSVVGIVISPQMLAVAAHRCEGHQNVVFRGSDATSLPVADADFDACAPCRSSSTSRTSMPPWPICTVCCESEVASWCGTSTGRRSPGTRRTPPEWSGCSKRGTSTFVATEKTPDAYGAAIIPLVQDFVAGRDRIGSEVAGAWAEEQRELGSRGEFFFACIQFCFTATKPNG